MHTDALATKIATGTDEQILDSFLLLSVMEVADRPAGYGPTVLAVEAELRRRPHLAPEVAAINAELDAIAEAEVAA